MFNMAGLPFALVESHLMLEQETPVKLSAMRGTGNKRLGVNTFTQHCSNLSKVSIFNISGSSSAQRRRRGDDTAEDANEHGQRLNARVQPDTRESLTHPPSFEHRRQSAKTYDSTDIGSPRGQTRSLSGAARARRPRPRSTPTSVLTICRPDEQPADVSRRSRT